MPGTTPTLDQFENMLLEGQYDRMPDFADPMLMRLAVTKNRLLDLIFNRDEENKKIKGFGQVHFNYKGTVAVKDYEPNDGDDELKNWGHLTQMEVAERAARLRGQMEFEYLYEGVPITEAGEDEAQHNMGKRGQIRNYIKEMVKTADLRVSRKLNQRFANGAGAVITVDGKRQQQLFGYQNVLQDSASGSYLGFARSGNTFLQNQVLAGNAGANTSFVADAIERNRTLIDLTTIDYDGEEHQAKYALGNRASLRKVQTAYDNATTFNVTVTEGMDKQGGYHGSKYTVLDGVYFGYDNNISTSNHRLYYINPDVWHIFSKYASLTKFIPPRTLEAMVGEDKVSGWKMKLAMVCWHVASQGVMTNTNT